MISVLPRLLKHQNRVSECVQMNIWLLLVKLCFWLLRHLRPLFWILTHFPAHAHGIKQITIVHCSKKYIQCFQRNLCEFFSLYKGFGFHLAAVLVFVIHYRMSYSINSIVRRFGTLVAKCKYIIFFLNYWQI